MNKTIPILENITKLSTNILMTNSNNYLSIYLEKVLNKKSKTLKFIPEFNCELLELLYTSLQMMNYNDTLKLEDYNKLDKIELKKYLTSLGNYQNIVPTLKTDLSLINYITKSLSNGSYAYTSNGKVKFDNNLVVELTWLVELSNFLIKSFIVNENLSNDRKTYSVKLVKIPDTKENVRQITKETEVYELNITRKDKRIMKLANLTYLKEALEEINKYDFKIIKELTSKLGKNKYNLSVTKKQARFDSDDKTMIEKCLNENTDHTELIDYIKEVLDSKDSVSTLNKLELVDTYELLKDIAYDYKLNTPIEKCRNKYDFTDKKQLINSALSIANFYNYYIFDEDQLKKYFDYEKLDLSKVKPTVIDYETEEYKNILAELSTLNKKVVAENRNINRLLAKGRIRVTAKPSKNNEKNTEIANSCRELERLAASIKKLREQLSKEKDSNDHISNINKTKIRYIKESIINGKYKFNQKEDSIIFDCYSSKDNHKTFHLEINLDDFDSQVLSEDNQKLRLEFYQK